ncbi:MAG: methyltransferase domain-containing protein [Anaerolineae bacterium]
MRAGFVHLVSEVGMADLTASSFAFACPVCRKPLEGVAPDKWRCSADGTHYSCEEGIWRFLISERGAYFQQFMQEYETVRRGEGRGSHDQAYYRALPFDDLTGRYADQWAIRARSFQTLVNQVVAPIEAERSQPLKILDLGSGNGWLSYRLSQRGHHVAAVDLLTNPTDGLGAYIYYDLAFVPIQAEFDRLPLAQDEVDLAIFNASFHYSTDYETTLREALRVLRGVGRLVILDTPVYRDPASGQQMVREREARFEREYGFPSNAIPSQNYLTFEQLEHLETTLRLCWQRIVPFYGWRWSLKPYWARLRGSREPAQFMLIVGCP